MSATIHPVDEMLPVPRMAALGLQHVLVMYANAVAVPLILGGALHLPKDQLALLINADLVACGIAALIQAIGIGMFGIRLPIIMSVTAVAISVMLTMAAMPGLTGIYGAVIVGGLFGLPVALKPIFGDGIIMTSIAAVLLNAYFNRTSTEEARQGAMLAAEAAEHLCIEEDGRASTRARGCPDPRRAGGPSIPLMGGRTGGGHADLSTVSVAPS
jgi:xanthine/uracil permease